MQARSVNCRRLRVALACILWGVGGFAVFRDAAAAAPTVSHLFPAGGQRGTKVAVTVSGTFTWPVKVWSPGVEVAVGSDSGKLEITIPADLPADRVWLRLYTAEGASATTPFLVGNLLEQNEQEPNNASRSAPKVDAVGLTINGALENGDIDCFTVELQAGQTLVAALDAQARLGSPMDAVLQVATPAGIVLAENHDDVQLDPRLAFTAKVAGVYVVRLFAFSSTPDTSVSFHGGANYIYRLTLTTGPYITHATPLAVSSTQPATVDVFGWNIPAGTKIPVTPLGGGRLAEHQEFVPPGDLRSPSEVRLGLVSDRAMAGAARVWLLPREVAESTASADSAVAALALPTSITGRIMTPRQVDTYRVSLKKGQTVILAAESQLLDLQVDPVLQLIDPAGKPVAEVDDLGSARDAAFTYAAVVDGEYRVTVRDQQRQVSERSVYRLTARLEESDFELAAAADTIVIAPDKPTELAIKIVRRTGPVAVGPIQFEAVGLPPGVALAPATSEPTGPTAAEVKLVFTSTGPAFSGPVRIVGKATVPGPLERAVRTPAKLGVALEAFWLTVLEKPLPK